MGWSFLDGVRMAQPGETPDSCLWVLSAQLLFLLVEVMGTLAWVWSTETRVKTAGLRGVEEGLGESPAILLHSKAPRRSWRWCKSSEFSWSLGNCPMTVHSWESGWGSVYSSALRGWRNPQLPRGRAGILASSFPLRSCNPTLGRLRLPHP